MNPKGHQANLVASHPGNRNAEKAGVFSPRRRAEAAAEVKAGLEADPIGYLRADQFDLYAELRGYLDLLARDLADKGVSDRQGKPRRTAGMFAKALETCLEAQNRLRAELDIGVGDQSYLEEPWTEGEGLDLLRSFAHDPMVLTGSRITAIRLLIERAGSVVDREFYADLEALSNEELDRELFALVYRVPWNKVPSTEHCRLYNLLTYLGNQRIVTEEQYEELLGLLNNATGEMTETSTTGDADETLETVPDEA